MQQREAPRPPNNHDLAVCGVYISLWKLKSTEKTECKAFSPIVGIGTAPTPHPQASVPPPPGSGGEGHSRWRERGWESPDSDERTCTVVVLFIYTYFVLKSIGDVGKERNNNCVLYSMCNS